MSCVMAHWFQLCGEIVGISNLAQMLVQMKLVNLWVSLTDDWNGLEIVHPQIITSSLNYNLEQGTISFYQTCPFLQGGIQISTVIQSWLPQIRKSWFCPSTILEVLISCLFQWLLGSIVHLIVLKLFWILNEMWFLSGDDFSQKITKMRLILLG